MINNFFDIDGKVDAFVESEDIKIKDISLFDYINNISNSKTPIDITKSYSPFTVNRGFMQYQDTVFSANILNKLNIDDKQAHYDFLFYSIGKRKRFAKWAKVEKYDFEDIIKFIQDEYFYTRKRAIEFYYMLNDEDLENINKAMNVGLQKGK